MRTCITSNNIDDVIGKIKQSEAAERIYDFSETDFRALEANHIRDLFIALSYLPLSITLKLNNCKFSENHPKHIEELTLGLSATKTIEALEFKKSIEEKSVLLDIVISICRNSSIKKIDFAGLTAVPPLAHHLLAHHPSAVSVFINDFAVTMQFTFFSPGSKASSSPEVSTNPLRKKI